MAVQLINVGSIANDGTGDDLREAMIKINQNFEELDLRDDEQTTASNLGGIGEGIFAQRNGYDLQFKSLVAGTNISLSSTDNTVVVNGADSVLELIVGSDLGSSVLSSSNSNFSIRGGAGISTAIVNNVLTIENTGMLSLSDDPNPVLSGNLQVQNFNITGVNTLTSSVVNAFSISAPTITGDVTGLVHGIDIRELENYFTSYDFGDLESEATGILDFIFKSFDVDLGTFTDPSSVGVDFGEL